MRRLLLGFAGVALGAAAHAADAPQPAPVAPPAPAAAAPARAAAQPLGRFFFSPTERAQLDIARLQKKAPSAAPDAVEAPPAPQVVTYGGLVRRSDGRQMLWLNNQLVDAKEGLAGLSLKGRVKPDGAVTLQAQSGATVDVKVGQSVEVYTGRVAETRKPQAETPKPPADAKAEEGKPAEGKDTAESKPPPVAAKPPAAEGTEKKPPPGGLGLRMDLGGRALSAEEAARVSSK